MTRRSVVVVVVWLAVMAVVMGACSAPASPAAPTAAPPTATAVPASPTPVPASPTPVPPTATAVPPTRTPVPPTPTPVPTSAPTESGTTAAEVPHPSNPGGPGPAVNLTGNAQNGIAVYNLKSVDKNCASCHGPEGKGEIANPGSTDGTVPPLNPIDEALVDKDLKVFAQNIDLFIEHGSTPDGPNPQLTMPAWGDDKTLTPQQIADVIAYIISLNK